MSDQLSEDDLKALLGTDYEAVLLDALRDKSDARGRRYEDKPLGQVGNGHVFFDPFGAIENGVGRYRGRKDEEAAQGKFDKTLADQNSGRMIAARALQGAGQAGAAPPGGPVPDSTIPASPPIPPSAPTTMFNPTAPKPPMPPQGAAPMTPPGPLGPRPGGGTGEPLRGPPMPGAARPPLAQAQTMDPAALGRAGVPPDVMALLAKLRGG